MKWLTRKENKIRLRLDYLNTLNEMSRYRRSLLYDDLEIEKSIKEVKEDIERLMLG